MKIKSDFFIPCQSTVIDSETNSISLMNVIDSISTKEPTQITGVRFIGRLTVEDSSDDTEAELEISLFSPNGKEQEVAEGNSKSYSVNIEPNTEIQRTGLIADITFNAIESGPYTFRMTYGEEVLAEQTIFIEFNVSE